VQKKLQIEDKNSSNNKEILNKKRIRDQKEKKTKEIKKTVEKNNYISDDEYESSEDKSYLAESENESSESYSSSSSRSAKKPKTSTKPAKKIIHKKEKKDSGSSSNKKRLLKPKGSLVYEVLERWWYALPHWPPENYDVSEKMKENKLRLVKIIDWKKEPKLDNNNFEKCLELPGYKYVYLNTDGKVFDFRPEEGKPSYNNFMKLPEVKLYEYLVKALKAQLEELEKRDSILEKELRKEIKEKLDKAEKNLSRCKQ
jgi:hypothetical protein